jgi:hypothetical protein
MTIIEGEKTMKNFKYQCNMALREHMLSGHRVTLIEALLIFGVQALNRQLTTMKRSGIFIKSQKIPMIKVVNRMKKYSVCNPPKNLPTKEILMTEYWVSK